VWSRIF